MVKVNVEPSPDLARSPTCTLLMNAMGGGSWRHRHRGALELRQLRFRPIRQTSADFVYGALFSVIASGSVRTARGGRCSSDGASCSAGWTSCAVRFIPCRPGRTIMRRAKRASSRLTERSVRGSTRCVCGAAWRRSQAFRPPRRRSGSRTRACPSACVAVQMREAITVEDEGVFRRDHPGTLRTDPPLLLHPLPRRRKPITAPLRCPVPPALPAAP